MTRSQVRKFARNQFETLCKSGDSSDMVSVDYRGMQIVDPWMDPSGRFTLSEEEARGMYGCELIDEFSRKAAEAAGKV